MRQQFLPYNPKLKQVARNLRNHSTLAEVLLWNQLKRKQVRGYDFHRQKPVDSYVVDFFCPKLMLAIEVDGTSHMSIEEKDVRRQKRLEELGVYFLRFDDLDVKFRMDDVLRTIEHWMDEHANTPRPSFVGAPLSRGDS